MVLEIHAYYEMDEFKKAADRANLLGAKKRHTTKRA